MRLEHFVSFRFFKLRLIQAFNGFGSKFDHLALSKVDALPKHTREREKTDLTSVRMASEIVHRGSQLPGSLIDLHSASASCGNIS